MKQLLSLGYSLKWVIKKIRSGPANNGSEVILAYVFLFQLLLFYYFGKCFGSYYSWTSSSNQPYGMSAEQQDVSTHTSYLGAMLTVSASSFGPPALRCLPPPKP